MSIADASHVKELQIMTPVGRSFLVGLYIFLGILSIPCSIFIFVQFARKRTLRNQISNHVILALLACSFLQVIVELPWILFTLWTNTATFQTDLFCKLWAHVDFSCNASLLMLMGFGSIERYLLIFNRNWILKHIVMMHYVPIVFSMVYPFLLYIGLIYFYPCANQFDYTITACGGPCYFFEAFVSSLDQLVNIGLPLLVGSMANLVLIMRVLYQKRRMKQQGMWKKNRRLIVQLLSLVLIHNVIWIPLLVVTLIMVFSPVPDPFIVQLNLNVLSYGIYVVILLCPFVSMMSVPDIWPQSVKRWFRPNAVNTSLHPLATRN